MGPFLHRRTSSRILRAAFLLTALAFARPAAAADIAWNHGGANSLASNGANWAGAVAPTNGDHVIFGAAAPTAPCTWDIAGITLSSVDFSGYLSTVTLNTGMAASLTVLSTANRSATLDLDGQSLTIGTTLRADGLTIKSSVSGSSVVFDGASAGFATKSDGPLHFENVVFNLSAAGFQTIGSNLVVDQGFTVLGGTVVAQGARIEFGGNLFLGAYLDVHTSTFVLTGSSPQGFNGSGGAKITSAAGLFVQNPSTTTIPGLPGIDVFVATRAAATVAFNAGDPFPIGSFTVQGGGANSRVLLITDSPGSQANLSVTGAVAADFAYVQDLNASGGENILATHSIDGGDNANWTILIGGAKPVWNHGGGNSLASNAANWSTGIAPSTGDFVTFDSLSNTPCTWDLNIQVASLSVVGAYSSTVTLAFDMGAAFGVNLAAPGAALNLAGHALHDQGSWSVGTANVYGTAGSSVSFEGAGPSTMTSLAAGTLFFPGLSINMTAGGFVTAQAPLAVANEFDVIAGTFEAGGYREEIGGVLDVLGGYLDVSASTLAFSGSGAQAALLAGAAHASPVPVMYVQSPATTTIGGWTVGLFVATTPASGLTFATGGSALTVGTFTASGQGLGTLQTLSGPGSIDATAGADVRYASVAGLDATGLTIPALFSLDEGGNVNWSITNSGGAVRIWRYAGGSALASNGANWVGGVAPQADDFVVFGASTPASPCTWDISLEISSFSVSGAYASTVVLSTNLTVVDGVRLDAPAGSLNPAGLEIFDSGDWLATTNSLTGGVAASTVAFLGEMASNLAAIGSGPLRFGGVLFAKDSGVDVWVNSNLTVAGTFESDGGEVDGGANLLNLGGNLLIGGADLDVTLSTLAFSGTSPQGTGPGQGHGGSITPFADLYVQNPTTTTILAAEADVFIATTPSATVAFDSSFGVPTFGDFTVEGQAVGTRVSLVSDSPGTQEQIEVTGAASVDYANIQDLDATPSPIAPLDATHSVDGGDNNGWSISSIGGLKPAWSYGGVSHLASDPTNWSDGIVPSTGDFVTFGGLTPTAPCTWDLAGVAVASFSVSGSYAGVITLAADLYQSSGAGVQFDAAGATLDFAGHAIRATGNWNAGGATLTSSVQGSSVVFYGPGTSNVVSLVGGPVSFQGFVSSKDALGAVLPQANLNVAGDFVMQSGTFSAPGFNMNLGGNLYLLGGYLDVSGSTVVFTGAGSQSIQGSHNGQATSFGGIDIQTTQGVTLPGITTGILIDTAPNSEIALATPSGPLVIGVLQIDGQNQGTRVRLQSSSPGTQIEMQVNAAALVNNASVQDNNATFGIPVIATNTLDLGDNLGWTFVTNGLGIQAAYFSADAISSATFVWFSNFGLGQTYCAQLSTGAFPNNFAGNKSSATLNLSATFTGLSADVQYNGQVSTSAACTPFSTVGPFSNAGTTVTYTNVPTGPDVVGAFFSSVTFTWGGLAANATYTLYNAGASTDSFATITNSTEVTGGTGTITGLASNATYFFMVQSQNFVGIGSAFTSLISTETLAVPPALGAGPAVTSNTVAASWSSGGDYAGTRFEIQISTNGYGTLVNSTQAVALSATFYALTPATTYQLRVRAISLGGVPTAFVQLATATTLLASPAAASPPFPAVGVSSVSVAWASGGNGGGTIYSVDLSTDGFNTVNFTSATQNLSALFGTGGAGAALAPNTTYFVRVEAASGGDVSAYLPIGSTFTLPGNPAAPLASDVETTSGTWAWGAGGDPAGTAFRAELSTNSFVTLNSSITTTGTSAVFSGLAPNTTFQFRVQTVGLDGYASAFQVAAASATLPSAPSSVATAVTASSVHLTWSDGDAPPLSFAAFASTAPDFSGTVFTSATANAFADVSGLAADTTYFLAVRAFGASGGGATSVEATTATLALPPGAPAFTASSVAQATAAWTSGGNPAGALYDAEVSTDSFATPALILSSVTASLTASFSALEGDTTYELRVRALDRDGTTTSYVAGASTTTAVATPAPAAFTGVDAADVTANWGGGGNGAGTLYEVQSTTNVFPTFNASARTAALSFDFSGLLLNTTYAFQVRAIGRGGTLTTFVALGTTQTLLLTPGVPGSPFVAVGVSSVDVSWLNGGNGAGVVYQADVSTDDFATVNLTSATQNLTATFGSDGAGPALIPDSTYYFRVRATGGSNQSPYAALGSANTYPADPHPVSVTAANTASVTLGWGANSNPATTLYQAQASSTAFASLVGTSQGASLSAVFGSLLSNATYQLRVRTLGIQGPGAYVNLSTWTQPAAPAAPAETALDFTDAAVTWGALNAPGTPYLVQLTTTSFPNVYASSTTASSTATFSGLAANTTYFAQVEAYAPDGTGPGFVAAALSTATPAETPGAFGVSAISPIGTTTGTWTWSIGANGPTLYQIDVSLAPTFFSIQQSQFVTISSAAGAAVSLAGLQPNSTEYLRIRANGWNGDTAYASTSNVTNAATPTTPDFNSGDVGESSITVRWNTGGNQLPINFVVQISTDDFGSVNSQFTTGSLFQAFPGLESDATYYFRVQALGINGPSPFSAAASTITYTASPGVAVPAFLAVGVSSVAVAWTSGGNGPGVQYQADVSTDNFATLVVSSLTANLSAVFGTGGDGSLTPDTSYEFRVAAGPGAGQSPEVALGSTATYAANPSAPSATALSTGSAELSWTAGGNPSDAVYLTEISTDNFATISNSTAGEATTAAFGGLVPDTTYELRVQALGRGGIGTAFFAAPSTATYAAAPSAPAGAYGLSSATLTWSASGDPATTIYLAELSTGALPNAFAGNSSSATRNLSAPFSGLASNATYFLAVEALGIDGATAFASAAASATAAAVPAAPSAAALGVSSASMSWTADGNGPGTVYDAQISTDHFATVVQSSLTANLFAAFAGLDANASYYLQAAAVQWNGGLTAFAAAGSTNTPVAAPASLPLVSVGSGSVVAAWGANGNYPGTLYEAQSSSDAFADVATATVSATQAGFGGLLANTAYVFRVAAIADGGVLSAFVALPATTTLLNSPGVPGSPFLAVGLSSVSVSWTNGGNGPGTNYLAQVSTDNFATLVVSSLTANQSAVFGTGGVGTLTPDRTYQFQVSASSNSESSLPAALGSTTTLAADPAAPAASAASTGTLTLAWGADGNPFDTQYQAQLSTNSFVTVDQTSAVKTTSAVFLLLTPDTTYELRVRAVGRGGTTNAYVAAPASATYAAAPSGATAVFGVASATLSWSASGNPATTIYQADVSTGAFPNSFAGNVSSTTQNLSAGFAGLAPNTTYFLEVQALGVMAPTAFDAIAASATVAAVPASPAATAPGVSSAAISWASDGDPSGTLYAAQLSTNDFATVNASSVTANTSAVFPGLVSNATYYERVEAEGWEGGFSTFSAIVATTTPVALPTSLPTVSVGTGTVVAAWGTGGNSTGTLYDAQISTDGFATVVATVRLASTEAAFGGLESNFLYELQARAIGDDGTLTAFVALPSTQTLLNSPGVPGQPFLAVGLSSVAVSWTTGGNGPGTDYLAQVSTDGFATLVVSSATQNLSAVFGTGGAGSLQPDTSYQFRVEATTNTGASAFVPLGSTTTLAADPAAPAASAASTGTLTLAWGADGNPFDTQYQAQLSTNSFVTVDQTSAVKTTSAVFLLLTPDTTYELRVRAVGRGGTTNAYVAAPASATYAAAPSGATAVFGVASATLSWSASGNPATTIYQADVSTGAFPNSFAGNVSSTTQNLSAGFAGLAPNTTYFLEVQALGVMAPTAFDAIAASATVAAVPASPAATAPGVSSAAISWASDGDPSGTLYAAQLSTNDFATVNASSVTANTSAVFPGLVSNATYYERVEAEGWEGGFSTFSAIVATTTPVALPTSLPLVSVTTGVIVAAWGTDGNSTGTLYDAQVSTDSFATVNATVRTASTEAAFGGLGSNATFYLQVRAIGNDGTLTAFVALPSTTTFLLPPAAAAAPFPSVGLSSVTVSWTAGGNGPGALYRAQLSTNGFVSVVVGSDTQNLSAVFGTGGAGAALTPDATFEARVFTISVGGGNQSAILVVGSTGTLAADPAAPAASAASTGTLTLSWGADGNPSDTLYQAQLSTNSFATVNQSSAVQTTSAVFLPLTPDTTYELRVRAVARAGTADAYVAAPASATYAAAPSAAAAVFGVTSATLSWSASGNPATTVYQADLSTGAFPNSFAGNASSSTRGLSAGFPGLLPNTTYFLEVQALGVTAPTAFDAVAASATVAAVPASPAAAAPGASSVSIAWTADGNPAGTVYGAELSTNNFATLNAASVTANTSAIFTGLVSNATYYQRVQAEGWDGGFSAFATAPATTTPVAVPLSSGPASVATGTVVAAWGANGNSAGTLYDAQISTNGFATLNATQRLTGAQAAFGGLTSNTLYSFQVRAIGDDGTLTAFVALPSTTTLLLPPAPAAVPFPAVGISSVAVAWTAGGNGPGAIYRAQISTNGFFSVSITSDTQNLGVTFGTGGVGGPLPSDTTYEARVLTVNGSDDSAILVIGSTGTFAADPSAPAVSTAASTGTLTLAWGADGNPPDTLYQAQLSTNSFATVKQSSAVQAASAGFSGLTPDTTYELRVRAVARAGTANAYVAAPSSATYAAAPSAPLVVLTTTSALFTWSASGDPATTVYRSEISTDAFATLSQSTAAAGTASQFFGLVPNTTYYLQVQALGLMAPTAFAAPAPAATNPAAPTAAQSSALGVSSAAIAWSAVDSTGTLYTAEISTDDFATLVQSSVTASLNASFAGLQANATYYQRVQADGWNETLSAFDAAPATTTPVAVPLSSGPASVATGTVVAAWGADGNSAGTLYDAQISTNGFATLNATRRLAGTQAAFGGLLSNTAYELQVRAVGDDGTLTPFVALPSTTTDLLPPGAAPFGGVGVSSVTLAWTAGGNGPGTVYRAQISTDGFLSVSIGSDTANLSVVFGSGGAGSPLPANTLYSARVLTVNGGNESALVPLGSTSTLAYGPTGTGVVAVTSQTVALSWSANGNPAGTEYQLQSALAATFASPTTTALSTTIALVAGLATGTTYYFRVRAVSAAGAPTGYDVTASTATLPPAPGQPGRPAASALGVSSLTWTWSAATFASSYQLYADSSAAFLLNVQSSAAFVESGLGPNSSSYLLVVGVNGSGPGPRSLASVGWTLADPPTGTAASGVFATSATLTWGLNGNAPDTGASVQRSLDGLTFAAAASTAAVTTFTDVNLLGCTTYYYRVQNFNGAGLGTAFGGVVSFQTVPSTPLAPTGLSAQPQAGFRVALAWSPSPSTDIVAYSLYSDGGTGVVNFAAPYATFSSSVTSFLTPPLASSAAYAFDLRATNHCGVQEQNTTSRAISAAVATPGAVTAVVSSPPGGRHVNGNRVTVAAALVNGQLTALSSILFQYSVSGANAWTNMTAALPAHPNPATLAPAYIQWDVTGLASGAYDLRAVAFALNGTTDTMPAATTIDVDPVAPDIVESDIGGGVSQRVQTVYASIANTVIVGGEALGDPLVQLLLPGGALATSTATLTLTSDPALIGITTAPAGAQGVGLFASILLSNLQTQLSGGLSAALTLTYPDVNNTGIVDGSGGVEASNLRFFSYNTLTSAWQQDLTTTFNPSARTATGLTPHFSTFGLFGIAPEAVTLDGVRVYPVPFRPNGTNPDEGRPYAAGNPNSGIVFDGLPTTARVQIYTIDGRLVADLSNNGSSVLQWDVRNGTGRDVASGGYFAVVSSPGLKSVVRRLSIIR